MTAPISRYSTFWTAGLTTQRRQTDTISQFPRWRCLSRRFPVPVGFLLGQLKCFSVSKTCRCLWTLIPSLIVLFVLLPKHSEHVLQIAFSRLCVPEHLFWPLKKAEGSWERSRCRQYVNLISMFLRDLSLDQAAPTLLDTQLNTAGGSLTCNYTQPNILTHTEKTTALTALQHYTQTPPPRGTNLCFMLNTCYLLCMYCMVRAVHANQAKQVR